MFDKQKFKQLCAERNALHPAMEAARDRLWAEMADLAAKNEEHLQGFIRYMRSEMTEDEYSILSEFSTELSEICPSWEFIDAYRSLIQKYPEMTKLAQIESFIDEAEYIVECRLSERKPQ